MCLTTGFLAARCLPAGRRDARKPHPAPAQTALATERVACLSRNLTFADAAEKGRKRDSGHSQVAITDLGMVPVERLHPRVAYSPSRPIAASGPGQDRSLADVRVGQRADAGPESGALA